jgi:hypothetical protein
VRILLAGSQNKRFNVVDLCRELLQQLQGMVRCKQNG